MPSYRFLLLLACIGLGICAGYSAGVLGTATWAEARALDLIFPFYSWRTRAFTDAEFERLRWGLAGAALVLAGLAGGLSYWPAMRAEIEALGHESRQVWTDLADGLSSLTARQRRQAIAAFAVLTAIRLYFSLYNPEYDDAVSYEVFVSKGLLATSSYYPIPNNHVLSNTISLLFYQANRSFWWSMRLPVLLVSTGATLFLFAALRKWANYRVAAVATTLFSCLQLSLYQAGVGRGYWLLILLAGVVFFSTLVLAEPRGRQRAAWVGLSVAGVLGCYTVPTFVYVLASAFSWLGLRFLRQQKWGSVGRLVAGASGIGMATAALYAPLLLVSGFDRFSGNGFVAALSAGSFWAGLPAYIWHNEGFLAGQRTLGAFITLFVLAATGWLFYQAHKGRLPAGAARRLRELGRPALWFVALPYAVIMVQRVFPPERVLLYKAFFFFMLAGLVVDWLLARWPAPTHRWPRRMLVAFTLLFVSYETCSIIRTNPAARGTNASYRAGLRWLAARPPGRVLIPEPTHNLFFRFYAHSELPRRNWQFDHLQRWNTSYSYVVAFPNKRGFFQPRFPFAPAYHNQDVEIYLVPPRYPLATKTWFH